MSEFFIEPDPLDIKFENIHAVIDEDGSVKILNNELSSYNFDGVIPLTSSTILVNQIKPGMLFFPVGASAGVLRTLLSIDFDDPQMIDTPSSDYILYYLDDNRDINSFQYSASNSITIVYENWDEKLLGSAGWTITQGGNAIFSNVAVRGRIEATEGAIEGDLTLGGSLTASTNLGFVQLSASGIFGTTSSGQFHLDTTTGEIDITGNINANSGQIKTLNIGPTQYPIFNIFGVFTSSATTSASNSGQFILVTPIYKDYAPPPGGGPAGQVYNKKLIPGDVFKLQNTQTTSSCVIEYYTPVGASVMFNTGAKVQPDDTGPWSYQDNKFIVLSASYGQSDFSYMSIGPYAVYVNKYHCKYHWYPDNFPLQIDFNGVTTASGTFNIGYLSFVASQESVFKTSDGFESRTSIDGIVLANYRKKITNYSLGDFLQVPDYIDLGGTFKLGNGNITFDGDNLNIIGNINATGGEISGNLSLGGSLTASTNTGQLILSSSGIFGSTASGLFHLDNIDGEVTFTGDITANSGVVKKLTIGAGKSYPITNLVGTASVTDALQSGNFILTLDSNLKNFYPGDYFYINGSKTSGSAFQNGSLTTASLFFNTLSINKDGSWSSPYVYKILTASYGYPTDAYFCRLQQDGLIDNYDFSQVTASSGSINFGYVYLGEYTSYSLSGGTFIDGLVFSTVGPGTYFQSYIPDYIDLSGRFSLGKGKITFDGTTLNVVGSIHATSGSFSGLIRSSSFSGITTQTGSSIGGIFQTPVYIGVTDGSAFSTKGSLLNFNNGAFSCRDFRIDTLGFSTFAGTFTGTLSASSLNSGGIRSTGYNGPPSTGSAFSTTGFHLNLNDGSIVSPAIRITNAGLGHFKGSVKTSDITIDSSSETNTAYITAEELFSGSTYDTVTMSFYSGRGTFSHNSKSWTVDSIFSNDGVTRISDWLSKPSGADISKFTIWNCGSITNNTSGVTLSGPTIALIVSASAVSASATQRVNIDSQTTRISGSVFFPQVYNTLVTSSRGVEIDSSGKLGYITSSFKAKENIVPLLENDYLNIPEEKLGRNSDLEFYYMDVLKLTPVQFDWIDGGKELGFISEQMQEVMPIASIDGDIPSYNPRVIMPALLAVVKKQQEYIEQLQSRVLQLESKLGG